MEQRTDTLQALQEAQRLYHGSKYMDRQSRHDAVISLSEWGLFTTSQLSQISGMSVSTIHGMGLKKGGGAGKFNPMSLDTLIQIRLGYNNGRPVSGMLLKIAIDEGNSHRVISKFTGLSTSSISRKLNEYNNSDLLGAAAQR